MNSQKFLRGNHLMLLSILPFLLVACATQKQRAAWPNWRGPNGDGSTAAGNYPVSWSETNNVLWKTPLPGKGCSTPIVWDDRIFVTAPADRQDAVLAFDWQGKELWRTKLGPAREGKHRNSSASNAAPATDGKTVFVVFTSGSFAALDFTGKVLWQTNLVEAFGRDTLYFDPGTAPVLTEKYVIMARMNQGESWLAAFDKATGTLQWKVARNYQTPQENDHGYNTPVPLRFAGQEALLVWAGEHVTVHSAAEGKLLWSAVIPNPNAGKNYPAVATPVVVDGVVIVPFGRSDRGTPLLFGVKLGQAGEFDTTNHLWQRTDTGTFVPSPTVSQKKVYLLRDRGEVECLDPLTGKTVWKDSLPKTSANYYGSTVIAGDKLYAVREDGAFYVASVGQKFEVLAENNMGERVIATPVLLNNRILVRGEKNLFCLGAK
jgi:outer membrane protein assembly factor BamB